MTSDDEVDEAPLHPQKVIVWCGLWAEGIFGSYFFKNESDHNVKISRVMTYLVSALSHVGGLWRDLRGREIYHCYC